MEAVAEGAVAQHRVEGFMVSIEFSLNFEGKWICLGGVGRSGRCGGGCGPSAQGGVVIS